MTRALVVLLASTLIFSPLSLASGSGTLEGRVVAPQGDATPTAVWAATAAQPQSPLRAPIGENGSCKLDSVPAGAVELAIETPRGLYLVETPVTIAPGERIAQLIIAPVVRAEFVEIDELDTTRRNAGGFGHTGG